MLIFLMKFNRIKYAQNKRFSKSHIINHSQNNDIKYHIKHILTKKVLRDSRYASRIYNKLMWEKVSNQTSDTRIPNKRSKKQTKNAHQ